jgi:hypothetical protein
MTQSTHRDGHVIALALGAYRRVLQLYPAAFRQRFGQEMIQFFRDSCRATQQERGGWGVLRLWLAILPDMLMTAMKEHVNSWNKGAWSMSTTTWARIGGAMAFVAVGSQFIAQGIALVTTLEPPNYLGRRAELGAEVAILLVILALAFVQRSRLVWGLWLGVFASLVLLSALMHTIVYAHQLMPIPGVTTSYQGWGPTSIVVIVLYAATYLTAFAAGIGTWRSRVLGRWSSAPFWLVAWSFVLIFYVGGITQLWLNGQFPAAIPSTDYFHALVLKDTVLLLPGWLLLMGVGLGLLHAAKQTEPKAEPAVQPSDAVQ